MSKEQATKDLIKWFNKYAGVLGLDVTIGTMETLKIYMLSRK